MVWSLREEAILETTLYNVGLAENFVASRADCTTSEIVEMPCNRVLAEAERLEKYRVHRPSVAPSHFRNLEAAEKTWDSTVSEKFVSQK